MRKVIFAINMSADGCCDHAKMVGSDEVLEYHGQLLQDADVLLFGRKTYELMVPYWPGVANNPSDETEATIKFARRFDAVKNIVVCSRTLTKTEGNKTSIIRNNLKEEVLKLKQQPGKNILVGGVDIPSQLIQLDLVDEFHLLIQPTIVGVGRRLFDTLPLPENLQLKLMATKPLPSDCIVLHYARQ